MNVARCSDSPVLFWPFLGYFLSVDGILNVTVFIFLKTHIVFSFFAPSSYFKDRQAFSVPL